MRKLVSCLYPNSIHIISSSRRVARLVVASQHKIMALSDAQLAECKEAFSLFDQVRRLCSWEADPHAVPAAACADARAAFAHCVRRIALHAGKAPAGAPNPGCC